MIRNHLKKTLLSILTNKSSRFCKNNNGFDKFKRKKMIKTDNVKNEQDIKQNNEKQSQNTENNQDEKNQEQIKQQDNSENKNIEQENLQQENQQQEIANKDYESNKKENENQNKEEEKDKGNQKEKETKEELYIITILKKYIEQIKKVIEEAKEDKEKQQVILDKLSNKYLMMFIIGFYYLGVPLLEYFQLKNQDMIKLNELVEDLEEGIIRVVHIEQQQKQGVHQQRMMVVYLDGRERQMIISNEMGVAELIKRHSSEGVEIQYGTYVDIFTLWDTLLRKSLTLAFVCLNVYYLRQLIKQSMLMQSEGLNRSNEIFNMGKSRAKLFNQQNNISVRFKDVAGMDQAKVEIAEFVDFLKNPSKYEALGARLPRGAILSGPPGTGKTMLAKACAGEAGVPFLYVSGSEFVEVYVGVGAARVRDLFKQAKKESPSIIFVDEIDAIGRKRDSGAGGNDEKDNTLNQLLVEMDGFETDHQVVVLAATNRKELLDSALVRPGRFDRNIQVGLPDLDGRKEILEVHLEPIKLDKTMTKDQYARRVASLSPGMSGAELANLCNEAAIIGARGDFECVQIGHFEEASERIIGGVRKRGLLDEEERRLVAVHESGHAVVSWFLEHASPLLKITIIPRAKGSLGFAQYLPSEQSLQSKEEVLQMIVVAMGGRCAERVFFNDVSTGAYDDLQKVYRIAYNAVIKLGFSDLVGNIGYKDNQYVNQVGEHQQHIIDQEVHKIINQAEQICMQLVQQHYQHIQNLSQQLLLHNTLDLNSIVQILGKRPFTPKPNFQAYLDTKQEIQQQKNLNQEDSESHSQDQQIKQEVEEVIQKMKNSVIV